MEGTWGGRRNTVVSHSAPGDLLPHDLSLDLRKWPPEQWCRDLRYPPTDTIGNFSKSDIKNQDPQSSSTYISRLIRFYYTIRGHLILPIQLYFILLKAKLNYINYKAEVSIILAFHTLASNPPSTGETKAKQIDRNSRAFLYQLHIFYYEPRDAVRSIHVC